jgi:TerB-C domain
LRVAKVLGLDQAHVNSDLHEGGQPDSPVQMQAAEADVQGEKIPASPKVSVTPLNVKRIAEIQADTARVSMVLGKIFSGDEEVIDVAPSTPTSPLLGLDQKHADFVGQIIQQSHWSESDFDQLAKSGGLMPSGALEVINEWSFQNFDDGLLDAYDGYDVAPEIAATLRAKLTMEN